MRPEPPRLEHDARLARAPGEGLVWLDENWQGDVNVPDELLPLVAAV
jgi:hypothetical protein